MNLRAPPLRPSSSNQLVDRLGASARRRLLACCELVQLHPAQVLSEPGAAIPHVYFPVDGFVSQVAFIEGDRGVEVGMVGHEGVVGAHVVLGITAAPLYALVQGAGTSLRLRAEDCRLELARSPGLVDLLHRFLYVQMAQMAISAGCLRYHLLSPRLARWLLMTHDRAEADSFPMTQQFLAYMLGVRRPGISTAAAALQRRGLIHYRRGIVTVLDRRGLQASACSCYVAGQDCLADALP